MESIRITGFRVFMGPKHFRFSQDPDCLRDPLKDFPRFKLKVSEPVITRVLLQTPSSAESLNGKLLSGKEENVDVLRPKLKSVVEAYHDPLDESDNEMKLETLSSNCTSNPNFWTRLNNFSSDDLASNQNKNNDLLGWDESSDSMESSSSHVAFSKSLNSCKIPDMSALVLSNMKTGRSSRTTNIIKNTWKSTFKATNKCTEIKSLPSNETLETDKRNSLDLYRKFSNSLNNVLYLEQNIYQDLNCVPLSKNNPDKEEETMTDLFEKSSLRNVSNKNSFSVRSPKNFENQNIKNLHQISTENAPRMHCVESDKLSCEPLVLKNTGFATENIITQSVSRKPIENSDNIEVVQTGATPFNSDTHVQINENMENDLKNHQKFAAISRVGGMTSSQVSDLKGTNKAKSVIFCPSSQSIPGNVNDALINLCDDCYRKTRKTVSDMQPQCRLELPTVNDKKNDLCKEHSTHKTEKQSCEFNSLNKPSIDNISKRLNMEDFYILCKEVNNQLSGSEPVDEEFLKNAMRSLREKWIQIISDKNSELTAVSDYLKYLKESSYKLFDMVIHSTDTEDNNAFHFACGNDRFDVVEELLKYECGYALLTQKNKLGHSPLMICSVSQPKNDKDWSVVKKILELGDVNETASFTKQTPLMIAASRGCIQMVRLMLEAGVNPNHQDNDGSTALMYAAVHGHEACVGLLLDHPKCNPLMKDYDYQTACSVALAAGYKEIALQIYFHLRKNRKVNKNKLISNFLQKKTDHLKMNSKLQVNTISRSQSSHQ